MSEKTLKETIIEKLEERDTDDQKNMILAIGFIITLFLSCFPFLLVGTITVAIIFMVNCILWIILATLVNILDKLIRRK